MLKEQGKLDQAAARYGKRSLSSRILPRHTTIGHVLKDQGKLDEAATATSERLALKPGLFRRHNNLGNVLRQQGKLDQAVAQYRASARSQARFRRGAQQPGQRR